MCRARRSNATEDLSSSSSFAPDLQCCRSISASRLEATSGSTEPRRKSCDVGDRNTLVLLFDINDNNNAPNADTKVESKNIRFSRLAHCDEELVEDAEIGEEIRVPVNTLQPNVEAANDDVSMEGELKTMKEYIDLEIHSKSQKPKDLKDIIAGNFWEAASVFSGKTETAETFMDIIDNEKKIVKYRIVKGDILNSYKSFIVTCEVETNGDDKFVTWTVVYEKLKEEIPEPLSYMEYFFTVTKELDDHHAKLNP
nr:UPF0503 protein At3g09070, chloroplastic-like [Ipomoea trifida]